MKSAFLNLSQRIIEILIMKEEHQAKVEMMRMMKRI
jgi:hypothetical protein